MNNLRKNRKTDFRNIIKNGKKENQNRILKIRKIRKIGKTGKSEIRKPEKLVWIAQIFFRGVWTPPQPPAPSLCTAIYDKEVDEGA